MKIEIMDEALRDLRKMDEPHLLSFQKIIDKIAHAPLGSRHMKRLPFFSPRVGQGRIVYQVEKDTVYIIRCFTTHDEYERWYRSIKK